MNREDFEDFDSPGIDLGPDYAAGIDPYNTDWSQTPPKVIAIDRVDGIWSKGPYVYNASLLETVKGVTVFGN